MPNINIGTNAYPSYIDVAYADEYLTADLSRSAAWAALDAVTKSKAVVTATRLLQRLTWKAGPPAVETATQPVKDATALLAADIVAKPSLGDAASTGSNVKSVGAGSARVEFFSPVQGNALPGAAFALLRDLLGEDDAGLLGLDNAAFGSANWQASRFDETDYGLWGFGADQRTMY